MLYRQSTWHANTRLTCPYAWEKGEGKRKGSNAKKKGKRREKDRENQRQRGGASWNIRAKNSSTRGRLGSEGIVEVREGLEGRCFVAFFRRVPFFSASLSSPCSSSTQIPCTASLFQATSWNESMQRLFSHLSSHILTSPDSTIGFLWAWVEGRRQKASLKGWMNTS